MTRKKKKNSKNPSVKKLLTPNPAQGFEKVVFFNSNRVKIPYGEATAHGFAAEQEVVSILERSNIPNELLLKPTKVLAGQNEISDGIILYGDTAFLLEVKSRNKSGEEIEDYTPEIRYAEKVVSGANKQIQKNLDYIQKMGEVTFEDRNNNLVTVRYSDYNWVGLILVNHEGFDEINLIKSLKIDNSPDRAFPRVVMSIQDLEIMSSGYQRIPYYILNYLRRLQYQSSHALGNDSRFLEFMVNGIHDYEKNNYFIEYEKVIMGLYTAKEIDKVTTKNLLLGLDTSAVEHMAKMQNWFLKKFTNAESKEFRVGLVKDCEMYKQNAAGYATVFYDSKRFSTNDVTQELESIGIDYLKRGSPYIKEIIVIAVDVQKTNPKKTTGLVVKTKNLVNPN